MKPFVKLWRQSSAEFLRLPAMSRAVFHEMMVYADENGRIGLGHGDHVGELCKVLGAHVGERRMMKKVIAPLLEDGCLIETDDAFVIKNTREFQEAKTYAAAKRAIASRARTQHELSANLTRTQHELVTNSARTGHELSANSARTVHEKQDNQPESFNTGSGEKSREEIEGEGDKRARTSGAPPPPPRLANPPPPMRTDRAVVGAFVAGYRDAFEARFGTLCTDIDQALLERSGGIDAVMRTAERFDDDPVEIARKCAGVWVNRREGERAPRWRFFVQDIGETLTQYNPKEARHAAVA